ncbi:MAG: OsmC family protein [Nitrospirota bacterium]
MGDDRMKLSVAFRGGVRLDVLSRSHTVVTDQPVEDGGADAGMSPVELFVGSLASCVGYFVVRYCARHRIPCDGFTVEAEWTMAEQPHRVGAVALRIQLPAELPPDQQERLLKVAHGCTVHQSLVVPPQVEIRLAPQGVRPGGD